MTEQQISTLTVSEIIDLIHRLTEELEIRVMELS